MLRKIILLISTLLTVGSVVLFVISITNSPRWVYSTPSSKTEYWLSRGDVGGRWSTEVDKSVLRQNVTVVEARVGDKVSRLVLPTTLWELNWHGFEIRREEQWIASPGKAFQVVFMAYPIILLAKRAHGWARRVISRIGWLRFAAWTIAIASLVLAGFYVLASYTGGRESEEHLIMATLVGTPGVVLASLMWLFRSRTQYDNSTGSTVSQSSRVAMGRAHSEGVHE
jgi:hypothetical protein